MYGQCHECGWILTTWIRRGERLISSHGGSEGDCRGSSQPPLTFVDEAWMARTTGQLEDFAREIGLEVQIEWHLLELGFWVISQPQHHRSITFAPILVQHTLGFMRFGESWSGKEDRVYEHTLR